jgi:2-dehydropantoate 2-reductase
MRIAVVGPGAIGSLFAFRFVNAGHIVQLIDHDPERAQAISRSGLHLCEQGIDSHVPVTCNVVEHAEQAIDLLCICVKAYDTAKAVTAAVRLITPDTIAASLQNGLQNAACMAKHLPPDRIVCAVTEQGATGISPGRVRHAGEGPTYVGPYCPAAQPAANRFLDVLLSAGLPAQLAERADTVCWSKAILNTGINPASAIWKIPNGSIPTHPEAAPLSQAACREAQKTANLLGIPLLFSDAWAAVCGLCERTAGNLSSMLQDVSTGRRTEIEAITGHIVRAAHDIGIETPACSELVDRVCALERSTSHQ